MAFFLAEEVGGQDTIQDELDRDRGENETHQPAGDLESDPADHFGAECHGPEDQEREGRDKNNGSGQDHVMRECCGLVREENDRGDGSGSGEHGDRQGRYGNIVFIDALGFFFLGFFEGRAAGLQHIQRHQEKHDASGDLKSRKRDPECRKKSLPEKKAQDQNAERDERGESCHVDPFGDRVLLSHDQKGGDESHGVYDDEEGRE